MNDDVFRALVEALERGETAALVTVVSTRGSTPQRTGAKMLVFADGRTVGTIGGGCYEHDAFGKARSAIRLSRPQLAQYDLNDDLAEESGLICGGHMEVYIEPVEPSPHLYIIGAGHISLFLARFASETGFRLHGAEEIAVDSIPGWLERATLRPGGYAVIVTRGHRHDLEALRILCTRELRYLGMIGSRTKVKQVVDTLLTEGVPAEALSRVHAPIGLDIGGVTPAEIAVSILAELIAVRNGRIDDPRVRALSRRSGQG
jgi:xanthine dehydrogenase accessory factor